MRRKQLKHHKAWQDQCIWTLRLIHRRNDTCKKDGLFFLSKYPSSGFEESGEKWQIGVAASSSLPSNMAETTYAVLALLPVVVYLIYHQLWQYRFKKFAHIPTSLKANTFIGHLGHMAAGFKKLGNARAHPGMINNCADR